MIVSRCFLNEGFTAVKTLIRATLAALVIGGLSAAAQADEIEDSLQMALEAYQAGDINVAKEEIDYAAQLIAQLKAAGLSEFLPGALPDWTRAEAEQGCPCRRFSP